MSKEKYSDLLKRLNMMRYNLYIPVALWNKLEKLVARRSRETEVTVSANDEIRRAVEKHLANEESRRT